METMQEFLRQRAHRNPHQPLDLDLMMPALQTTTRLLNIMQTS